MKDQSNLAIPEAALEDHIAVLGRTGSGKTYASKSIVEYLLDRQRQLCIVDPTSAWWGLRNSHNGKPSGYEIVVIGGKHADIPIGERTGAAIARLVTQQGVSVIVDIKELLPSARNRWFLDFAETMFATMSRPLHLVIDEAHVFMPKTIVRNDPLTGKMLHAGSNLISGGRSMGLRSILISQRPAKLHNDPLTCAGTLIAMKLIAPSDRAAVKDWMDGAADASKGKEVLSTLASMKKHHGWVWYPDGDFLECVKFPTIKTFDSSATPKSGAPRVVPVVRALAHLDDIKTALADAVKEAEQNDPKFLKARVANLETMLAQAKMVHFEARGKSPEPPKVIERAIVTPACRKTFDKLIGAMAKAIERGQWYLEHFTVSIAAVNEAMARASELTADLTAHEAETAPRPGGDVAKLCAQSVEDFGRQFEQLAGPMGRRAGANVGKAVVSTLTEPATSGDAVVVTPITNGLTGGQQRILDRLRMMEARKLSVSEQHIDKERISAWLGIHKNGNRFVGDLGGLRKLGYIDDKNHLTDLGRRSANKIPTGPDAALAAMTEGGQRKIVQVLLTNPNGIDKTGIAEALDLSPNGNRFVANLGHLKKMGVVTEKSPFHMTQAFYL